MIKPALLQKTSLQQTLTPQQIQYLKLLQMPIVSLEQTVQQEIEINPFLEESRDDDLDLYAAHDIFAPAPDQQNSNADLSDNSDFSENNITENFDTKAKSENNLYNFSDVDNNFSNDFSDNSNYENHLSSEKNDSIFTDDLKINRLEDDDSYDYYSYQWEDDGDFSPRNDDSDNDFEPFQIKDEISVYDDLIEQLTLVELSDEENLIALHIIGNIDEDGYLRRSLNEIVDETNSIIAEHNFEIQKEQHLKSSNNKNVDKNPAKKLELSNQSVDILNEAIEIVPELQRDLSSSRNILDKYKSENSSQKILSPIKIETAEKVLKIIQSLEPAGIASRNIQECLAAQLNFKTKLNESQKLALLILNEYFDDFSKKHFEALQKKLEITEAQIRDAFEEIKKLNPKPGGSDFKSQINTIIPDFLVAFNDDIDDLTIQINDSTIPNLKVSSTYEKIKQEAKNNKAYNKATKEWIRERFESARFFIQAVKQRNITMLMVMTAIVQRQREFFLGDLKNLKPMIYKDIADDTAFDISTICRIVNGKYALTKMGTFELKYFFSEALPNDEGEDVSTTVIKDKIKEYVALELKNKPYSDDKLCKLLKEEGYNVARRTIAKYRETLKIPVARLRREI
jgi:RNA polymerase sigma-54 factor